MTIQELIDKQKALYHTGQTKPYEFRIAMLNKLKKLIKDNETSILDALKKDLNKSEYEAYTAEIGYLYAEINHIIKDLKHWMKPTKVAAPLTHKGSKGMIYKEAYGVTLVIAPWNYPFQLALSPVLGAIAGGNTVVLKPSELTPNTSHLLADLITKNFDRAYFSVVEGDKDVSQKLLDQRFDLIFFTGSVPVGKIVMEKASQHLTPVVLELGGKSPAIVDEDADLDLAAKRIIWGKCLNAGQTCIAPDYLYVHESVKDALLSKLVVSIKEMYGDQPLENEEYSHIVNERHFDRLVDYIHNGNVFHGGEHKRENLVIEPTILTDATWDDRVMQDEIFGPILPVFTFHTIEEVVEAVRSNEKPLALYYFTEDEDRQQHIIEALPFGGGAMNDTLMHITNPNLPFGGVGQSGVGSYHGKASFDAFTHEKSILKQTTKFDFAFRYPSSKTGLSVIKKLFR